MKITKRLLIVVTMLIMSVICSTAVFADNALDVTYSAELDQPTISVSSEEQTVVMTIKTNKPVNVDGIGCTVIAPEGFGTAVSHPEIPFAKADYNASKLKFGWSHDWEDFDYYTVDTVVVVTYTIPANTPAGTYELGITKLSMTVDYGEEWEDGATATTTLTIKDACEHANTKAVSNGDGTHNVVCADESCGEVVTANVPCSDGDDKNHDCDACGATNVDNGHHGGTATCTAKAVCSECDVEYGEKDASNHASTKVTYTNNGNTHSATYDCCGGAYVTNEAHNYGEKHVCVCGKVEVFVITLDANDGKFSNGAPVYPVSAEYGTVYNAVPANPTRDGFTFTGWNTKADGSGETINVAPGTLTFTADLTLYAQWLKVYSGWTEIEGDWYYYDPETNEKVTGMTRVPYPTVAINGITYAPNAEDLAYYNAHKDTSKYSDAETAVFVFDEDGKLVQTTGIVDTNRFAVNGCVAWHVGFVKVGNDYYYFGGDENGNGNVMMIGKIYASRDYNSGKEVGNTSVYYFDENGKLLATAENGIVEIDGALYFFEDGIMVKGAGVVKLVDENDETFYIYVKSNGQLATGIYWPTNRNGLLESGAYNWGEDGRYYYNDPAEKEIREVDGVYYYYENGIKQIGNGVVEMTDANNETFYIYVKSNGQLATGLYWPTTRNDLLPRGEYDWGKDGKYYPAK